MTSLRSAGILVLGMSSVSFAYQWPNPSLDALETLRWDQSGFPTGILAAFTNPCDQFLFGSNSGHRTNAADWLRTAYHDMATYDVTTGEGGLDASIQFDEEQQRPENAGDTFSNTFAVISAVTNRHVSLADAIALGAIFAVEQCGGPKINFRGGRIDATKAGPPGVPEPQSDLQSHTEAFARQGFTPTEMIQLVACGHTIGGVQHKFFPDIVPESNDTENNAQGNVHFDSSFSVFDNHIATDYISGDTGNPLVVGSNITTRSDMRIFSSDQNVTMSAFAQSNDLFMSTCAGLFERMLNTVPQDVQLTEVIEPLPVKPVLTMVRAANGTLMLSGSVRFWNLDDSDDPEVSLIWAGEDGKQCNGCSVVLSHDKTFQFGISMPGNHRAPWYMLPGGGIHMATTDSPAFWFEIDQDGEKSIEDNGGAGFPLLKKVVLSDTSCVSPSGSFARFDIAVQKGVQPSRIFFEGDAFVPDLGTTIPKGMSTYIAVLNQTASANVPVYDIYSASLTSSSSIFGGRLNVAAPIDGKNVSDWTDFDGSFFFDGSHFC